MVESPLDSLISELTGMINSGELEDAFERLLNYLPRSRSKLYNDVLAQSARYQTVLRQELDGTRVGEQTRVEENKIRQWLIQFIGKLPAKIDRQLQPIRPPTIFVAETATKPLNVVNQKILGINNLKQISWIGRGLEASRSVCRILTPNGLGTGFLVGPGMIMTNNHVIPTAELAAASVAEFDYQQDASGRLLPTFRYECDSSKFHSSAGLDYSFVGLREAQGKPPLNSWGSLALNPNADPIPTEHVSIIQHPNGGLKQIVLTANQVVAVDRPRLQYTTDTMPGSSGSPVFDDTWHVVAIHHAAVNTTEQGYANEGILMSAIRDDAGRFWPAPG